MALDLFGLGQPALPHLTHCTGADRRVYVCKQVAPAGYTSPFPIRFTWLTRMSKSSRRLR